MKVVKQILENTEQLGLKMVLISLLITVYCPIFGQDTVKKEPTEAEYEKWGQLENKDISLKGNWASFHMQYDNGKDTLFVKHTKSNTTFVFPNGTNGKFGGEIAFGCFDTNNNLIVTNLETRERKVHPDIASFEFVNKGEIIITHSNTNKIVISNKNNNKIKSIKNVEEYKIDKQTNILSCITSFESDYSFGSFDLKMFQYNERYSSKNKLFALTIAEHGKGFFMVEEGNSFGETKLHYYNNSKSKGEIFNPKMFPNFPKDHDIVTRKPFKIAEDGKRIFFGIAKQSNEKTTTNNEVEVWNTEDPLVFPKTKVDNPEQYARLAVWFLKENRFLEITNNELPYVQLNGNKTTALIYSPIAHAPHFKKQGETDYYIYNVLNGTKTLFLEKQPSENNLLSFSPNGKYIAYFRNNNWWLFDIITQTNFCIEKPKGIEWASNDMKYSVRPNVFGMRGWSRDETTLFLQDEYDVFQLNIESKKLKRLTKGRENNTSYTLDQSNIKNVNTENYNGWALTSIDTDKNLVFRSFNKEDKSQQYKVLTKEKKWISLGNNRSKADEVRRANNDIYVYREQSYNESPRLICSNKGIKKVLYQSNTHEKKHNQAKVELITFYNSKGIKLQGIIYYPLNYQSGKTYPMIVSIYSQISHTLYNYSQPSLYNDTGFNIKHFVNQEYFVLVPDIHYYEGKTGQSALDCVVAATNNVIDKGMIDPNRIGLIGHSFGGYETNYIITQTNKFAAAVSGAGISDMVSWYFSNSKSLHIPELWRSETQQWRMGKSIFENKDVYLENSPILFANKVNTPVLLWVGKQETNLPYEQSIFFYNALRRAGKKSTLLLYPNDNHVIVNKQNKKDLTLKITNWFDKYLK